MTYRYGATWRFSPEVVAEIEAWTARQYRTRAEYQRTLADVDWFATDPYGTREAARRHAWLLDIAPESRVRTP